MMKGLEKLAVDTLGGEIFLPEEKAYVKAVLLRGGYSCAEEDIVLCPEDKEYIFGWGSLPCRHRQVSYYTDGHISVNARRRQTSVFHASFFVAYAGKQANLPRLALKIVVWRPYAKLWDLAEWLRHEIIKRNQ